MLVSARWDSWCYSCAGGEAVADKSDAYHARSPCHKVEVSFGGVRGSTKWASRLHSDTLLRFHYAMLGFWRAVRSAYATDADPRSLMMLLPWTIHLKAGCSFRW